MKAIPSYFGNVDYVVSVIMGLVFLLISLILNYFAVQFAAANASGPVADIILSNIPAFDVGLYFAYVPLVYIFFAVYLTLAEFKILPFVIKSVALFIFVRAIFITLTHIGPFPTHASLGTAEILRFFTLYDDLFFSGHVGIPFLLALIFHDNRVLFVLFFTGSLLGGFISLLGHLHYSIDVFASFFITYSIFHLSIYLFGGSYNIFRNGLPVVRKRRRGAIKH